MQEPAHLADLGDGFLEFPLGHVFWQEGADVLFPYSGYTV